MIAETTVRRIGNSKGITIPKELCDMLSFEVGSRVALDVEKDRLTVRSANGFTITELLKDWNGGRYKSEEIDWGEPVGKEMW